jgi:TRAP-type C4-dicarboxylate transport system substrate-binding protein
MSRSFFESLPEDVGNVLREAAVEVGRYHRALGQERDSEFLEVCRKHLEISPIDREEFVAATAPILKEMAEDFGRDLLDAVRKERDHGDSDEPGSAASAEPAR